MIKNQNIICISSIDWDFVWQGHQEIMSQFAAHGNRVLFIENTGVRTPAFRDISRVSKRFKNWITSIRGFKEERKNLFIYSPVVLPFPYSGIARWLNRRLFLRPLKKWLHIMKFREPIIWTFLPTGIALDIIQEIDHKLLVYYCIADFYELVSDHKKVKKTEDELLKQCDLIFAQGKILEDKCRRLNNNVHIFPFGVNMELFQKYQPKNNAIPADIAAIKKPVIGYVGGIHRHIDFDLIRTLAERNPSWNFVFVGPLQTETKEWKGQKNIFLLGQKEFSTLPAYIDSFDVSIIPYVISEYTKTVYPTKMNEYHAMGKIVVSTNLPEITLFNQHNNAPVLVGNNRDEFEQCIKKALDLSRDPIEIKKRKDCAEKNSWSSRVGEMSDLIDSSLQKNNTEPLDWQKNFLKLYKTWWRKAVKAITLIALLYLIIFHTSAAWFLARPLKISQPPQKADCIVVFAGGVGESGKAGEGYQERVEYAAELYNKGYAKNLIFSSGYAHIFNEPFLMQALAVSLNVPKEAIILETTAKNTYENVRSTSLLLAQRKWNSILLVSSPYHMLRAKLVFRKVSPEINVTYTPSPISVFYQHAADLLSQKVSVQQIRGIFHEYLGILLYWLRGYI